MMHFPKATRSFERYQTERSGQKAKPHKSKATVYAHVYIYVRKRQRQKVGGENGYREKGVHTPGAELARH